jgi:hypothetical protein
MCNNFSSDGFVDSFLGKESGATKSQPTRRAVDRWGRGPFFELFLASGFFRFDGESQPSHLPLTLTVGTLLTKHSVTLSWELTFREVSYTIPA